MALFDSTKVTMQKASTDRRAWSVHEVCERLGVSRNFLLGQIRCGLLRARRLGRRVVILTEDLDQYLQNANEVGGRACESHCSKTAQGDLKTR